MGNRENWAEENMALMRKTWKCGAENMKTIFNAKKYFKRSIL